MLLLTPLQLQLLVQYLGCLSGLMNEYAASQVVHSGCTAEVDAAGCNGMWGGALHKPYQCSASQCCVTWLATDKAQSSGSQQWLCCLAGSSMPGKWQMWVTLALAQHGSVDVLLCAGCWLQCTQVWWQRPLRLLSQQP